MEEIGRKVGEKAAKGAWGIKSAFWYNKGVVLGKLGRDEEAKASLKSTLSLKMKHVYAKVKISSPKKNKSIAGEMLIDAGAIYTCLPPKMAKDLGLPLIMETKATMADGREVKAIYSAAYIEINGREEATEV